MFDDRISAFLLQDGKVPSWDRKPIGTFLRYRALKAAKFTCCYCGRKAPDVKLHIDHIWPICLGGDNFPLNLVCACQECNAGKSGSLPEAGFVERRLSPMDGFYLRRLLKKRFNDHSELKSKTADCLRIGCLPVLLAQSVVEASDIDLCLEGLETNFDLQVHFG